MIQHGYYPSRIEYRGVLTNNEWTIPSSSSIENSGSATDAEREPIRQGFESGFNTIPAVELFNLNSRGSMSMG